jgi:hypothetical protein
LNENLQRTFLYIGIEWRNIMHFYSF